MRFKSSVRSRKYYVHKMNRTKIIVVQIIFDICKITFFSLTRPCVCDTLVSLSVIKYTIPHLFSEFLLDSLRRYS